jgi:hypothetical protein
MKKPVLVLFIIVTAMIGIAFPVAASQLIGGAMGYYDITSTPSGATVTVDGSVVGTTPTTASVFSTATPGHMIEIEKAGYQPWSQYYAGNPAEGDHIAVHASLARIPTIAPTPLPGSQKGFYQVRSDPAGAQVELDGTNYGLTPVTISVSSTGTPGHSITVSRAGYETWSQFYSGNPAAGQTIDVFASLTPVVQTGSIYVSSSPSGASAVLDNGYDHLTTDGTFSGVSTGLHSVRVSKSGYQPYSTSIQVTPGGTSNVFATLVANQQTGSLSVSSNPVGAGLYVDTIYQGLTNQIVGNLAIGPHTVTLKKSGYKDYSQTAMVNSAQTSYLSVTLTPLMSPTSGDLDVSSTPSGASVFLNGEYKGETRASGPLYITGVSPGTYTLVMKKSGYQDYTTATRVDAGSTVPVSAALVPSSSSTTIASAEIFSQPSGADVLINNAYKGITPLSLDNIPVDPTKTYSVEIRLTGYTPYTASGVIKPGQNVVINAALSPLVPPTTVTPLSLGTVLAALSLIGFLSVILKKKQ